MENKLKEIKSKIHTYISNNNIDSAKQYFKDELVKLLKEKINSYEEKKSEKKKKNDLTSSYYLAHYTSLETIYSVLKNHQEVSYEKAILNYPKLYSAFHSIFKSHKEKEEKKPNSNHLRIYDAFSVNDPNEGIHLKNKLQEDYKWLKHIKKDTEIEAFVCSFVHGNGDIGDQLRYWQSYGKDGLGCSIQIPGDFNIKIFDPVFYEDSAINHIKNTLKSYFNLMNFFCEESAEKDQKHFITEEDKRYFIKEFWKAFDKMKFLHKNKDYKNEKEYRCIAFPRTNLDIQYHFKNEGPYFRSYLLIPEFKANNLLRKKTRITIGPRVVNKERVCYNLKQLANQSNLFEIEFEISKIDYQKVW